LPFTNRVNTKTNAVDLITNAVIYYLKPGGCAFLLKCSNTFYCDLVPI